MATQVTTDFADLLDPSFRSIIKAWGEAEPTYYDKISSVENMTTNWVKDSYVTGLPTMPSKTEGSAPTEHVLTQRLDKTYTAASYGIKVTVAYELQDDDVSNTRIIKQIPSALAKSGRDALEVAVANHINRMENASYLGSDGKTLLATDHPTAAAGSTSTASNRPTNGVNLAETSLQDAITALENTNGEDGLRMGLKAKALIVAPALIWKASKLLDSSGAPEDATNAVNPLKGRVQLISNPYITDTNAWVLVSGKSPILTFIHEALTLKSFMAVDGSRNAVFAAYQRFISGWTYWMGMYGSAGLS